MAFLNIPPDKWKHIIVGFSLGIVGMAATSWVYPGSFWLPIVLCLGGITLIGFGFEAYSKITGYGHAELMDALATVAGGIIGVGIYLLLFQMIL